MKIFTLLLKISLLISLVFACGKKEDSDSSSDEKTDSLAITDLADLPDSTAPVAELSSEASEDDLDEVESFDKLEVDSALRLAKEGASIGDTVNDLNDRFNETSNASKAMCETTNQAMKYLFEMGSGDFLNCVVKTVLNDRDEIYDGKEHSVKMSTVMEEDGEETDVDYIVAVKASRNKAGVLVGYEMKTCESDDGGDSFAQNQYVKIDIVDSKYNYYSKMKGPDDNPGYSWVEVEANLNSKGRVAGLKKIIYNDHNDSGNTYAEIMQSSNNIFYNGANNSGRYYSFFELLDFNNDSLSEYAVSKISVGDGAALVVKDGDTHTQGWNGDSFKIDADAAQLFKVEGKTDKMVELEVVEDGSFASEETYDCESEVEIDLGSLDIDIFQGCMERFEIDQEGANFCTDLSY